MPFDEAGALEAVERILNRGGERTVVLQSILESLHVRGVSFAAVRAVEGARFVVGVGDDRDAGVEADVVFEGNRVASLTLVGVGDEFAERLATLISPYVRPR